ncbi:MAG: S9 family peptidase [Candidatus Cloacimonetes bacterium]|nr:S9 family peptidase [Candidatus Cloacimonadota bacterium]
MKFRLLISLIILITIISCSQEAVPPIAKVVPDTTIIHEVQLIDNYAWLKDKTRTEHEVLEYIKAENRYTKQKIKHTKRFQKKLYKEIVSRMSDTDLSVPVKRDNYYYYSRSEKDQQYNIYCRKKDSMDADEEIYLNVNKLAKGYDYYSIYNMSISTNQRYLAYGLDTTGSEIYTLKIKDLETGGYLEDTISPISDITWANDNKTIFYSTEDKTGRSYKIFRHVLDENPQVDELIFTEKDERFWVWVTKSKNKEYITIGTSSKITSECWFLDANDPFGEFKIIEPRKQEHSYYVLFHSDRIFIVTDDKAENFKLMEATIQNPSRKYWKDVIPHRDSVRISVDVFKDYLVISELSNGLEKLKIMEIDSGKSHYVNFPEPIYTFYTWSEIEFDSPILRYTYESLITPYSIIDYNMETREKEIMKQKEVVGGYEPAEYASERFFTKADDGTEIPISLVYRKDLSRKNGENPLYLTAYGAYGDRFDPYFSSDRLSLLDRGIIYAIAHVRGGGEFGKTWYDQGKMLNKKNTFTDFINCAESLISEKYTDKDKLIIDGGSAGGLLIGVVTNMRPDLFHGVIADVPFVDIINTMLDPSLSAVVSEYEEWGNPNEKEFFDYILSYSPYDNIEAKDYPNILVLAGFHDPRVNYWEPAKWVAKLRATKTDANLLLLQTNMVAGHGGSSGRYDYLKEVALTYSFIFDILGIEE